MTKHKFNSKRVAAFILCLMMVFTIVNFNPIEAKAMLQAPTNFTYDSAGNFTWLHPGAWDPDMRYVIRNEVGAELWSGVMQTVPISSLTLANLNLDWNQQSLPSFTANVIARRTTAAGTDISGSSNAFAVSPRTDASLNQILSLTDGTRLSWTPLISGIRPSGMIYRIYVNDQFRIALTDRNEYNLAEQNLAPGQSYNVRIRAINPTNFTVSEYSNPVSYSPPGQAFPLIINVVGAGSVNVNPSVSTASAGTTITLTATPSLGASFTRWEVVSGGIPIHNSTATSVAFVMPANDVSVRAIFDQGNLITIQRNNNALGEVSSNVSRAMQGAIVEISATPTVGSRFVRWDVISGNIVIENPELPNTRFMMQSSDVTIRANFEPGHGVVAGNNGQVAVHHTQQGGEVTLDLPATKVTEIITFTSAGAAAIIDLIRLENVTTVTMPRVALNQLVTSNMGVELRMAHGTVSINRDALSSLVTTATGANISISMHSFARASLNAAQQQAVSTQDAVYNFRINSAQQAISSYQGVIQIVVPYTGQLPVIVRRLFDNGTFGDQASTYNANARTVTFSPVSPMLYVVGPTGTVTPPPPTQPPPVDPDPPLRPNPFTDINTRQWFYTDVMFVYSRDLMGPTATNPMVFSPNANLSRAMIVTILHRREGTPTTTASNPFSDVPSNAWFNDAVVWAAASGIVSGRSATIFDPNANITRQELAVILMRYADYINVSFPTVTTYRNFADQNSIGTFARDAVRSAVEAGIITGREGNIFAPLANSTRAETAAMLRRFITAAGG